MQHNLPDLSARTSTPRGFKSIVRGDQLFPTRRHDFKNTEEQNIADELQSAAVEEKP